MGADIVVGEGQSIGNSLNFGGPYVGLFATREKLIRQTPGRYCGQTVDAEGKRGYVLTLSTREQHIRRDKATSNICTNSGLCALAFSVHMTLLGEKGLRRMAALSHEAACKTADALARVPGVKVLNKSYFNEFTLRLPTNASDVVEALAAKGVLAGVPGARLWPHDPETHNLLIVAATECVTDGDVEEFALKLGEVL
jgi:glycine dehydrogenase subunit 1